MEFWVPQNSVIFPGHAVAAGTYSVAPMRGLRYPLHNMPAGTQWLRSTTHIFEKEWCNLCAMKGSLAHTTTLLSLLLSAFFGQPVYFVASTIWRNGQPEWPHPHELLQLAVGLGVGIHHGAHFVLLWWVSTDGRNVKAGAGCSITILSF